jgi:hypothetical protein
MHAKLPALTQACTTFWRKKRTDIVYIGPVEIPIWIVSRFVDTTPKLCSTFKIVHDDVLFKVRSPAKSHLDFKNTPMATSQIKSKPIKRTETSNITDQQRSTLNKCSPDEQRHRQDVLCNVQAGLL